MSTGANGIALLLPLLLCGSTAPLVCNNYTLLYTGRAPNGTLGQRFKFADPEPNPHLLLRTYVPSATDCAAACEAVAECAGFAVFHHGGQLQCNTVDDVTPVGTSLVSESYMLHRAVAAAQFGWASASCGNPWALAGIPAVLGSRQLLSATRRRNGGSVVACAGIDGALTLVGYPSVSPDAAARLAHNAQVASVSC